MTAALALVKGTRFESFFKEFFPAVSELTFVPLGNTHDGGADGVDDGMFEGDRPGTFYQASVQSDHRGKIRQTVARLRDFGREPKTVFYVTNRLIQAIDLDEEDLTDDLGVNVRIRDGAWIANNINKNSQSQAAFVNHLAPLLNSIGWGKTSRTPAQLEANVPACIFLSYEVEHRRGRLGLLEAVIDSLILWGLEGTDPDKNRLLSKPDLIEKIVSTFPFADKFIRSGIDKRLAVLSSKGNATGREIREYRRIHQYCLPFETRKVVAEEHAQFEALIYRVREQLRDAALKLIAEGGRSTNEVDVVDVCMDSLELAFRNEGLRIGLIASGDDEAPELDAISDYVDENIIAKGLVGDTAFDTRDLSISILRRVFYESSIDQRSLLQTLSRTYALLFTLQYEPKIVEYFRTMRSHFRLYVGTDIFIRAISENYLTEENRHTQNLLRILKEAGSELLLTEFTLNEIHTHMKAADREFENHYASFEPYMTVKLASQIDRILIRAYFYATKSPAAGVRQPAGWKSYVDTFIPYADLHRAAGKDLLRAYLCARFNLKFEDAETIGGLVNQEEAEELTEKFAPFKSRRELAEGDANLVLLVYAKRRANNERFKGNPYGFSTWWLTQESKVQQHIAPLIAKNGGKCIIRPEFLLYYLSTSPKMTDVDTSYDKMFPSIYGVKLGARVKGHVLEDVLQRAKKYLAYEPARVHAELEQFANQLKSDQIRVYDLKDG